MTEKKARIRQKIVSVIYSSIAGMIIGGLFVSIAFGYDNIRLLKGIVAGFLITFTIEIFEKFVFVNNFKKINFSFSLLIRIVCYVLAISFPVILVWVVHESDVNNATFVQTVLSSDFRYFLFEGDFKKILAFSTAAAVLINFFMHINSLLGRNVLMNYITGKYHAPKSEERVFMFLDLSSSTTIAEKLDPVTYHKFMNSYFFDIDEPIVESRGEIYQYVGDEVVISWKGNKGFENANCIKCYFRINSKIKMLKQKYLDAFGLIPEFKAGLHCGKIVTGEIGDSKKEIVFHGDVMNTASRIQSQCNILNRRFLVSEDLLKNMELNGEFKIESMGKCRLKGKEHEVELFSISDDLSDN